VLGCPREAALVSHHPEVAQVIVVQIPHIVLLKRTTSYKQ
jgi:hypothetical protein